MRRLVKLELFFLSISFLGQRGPRSSDGSLRCSSFDDDGTAVLGALGQDSFSFFPFSGTGGGSDGNFTAALGVPTLDGLGVDGAGAHTLDEHLLVSSIAPRCALLASLIETITPETVQTLDGANSEDAP